MKFEILIVVGTAVLLTGCGSTVVMETPPLDDAYYWPDGSEQVTPDTLLIPNDTVY